jgi:hypothetical protein
MKYVIGYALAALAFVSGTAAMAAFAAPALLEQLDQGAVDSVLFAARWGFLF